MGDEVDTTEAAEGILAAIPSDAYPSLMRVAGEFAVKPYDDAAAFDFGLGLILDGLDELLPARSAPSNRAGGPKAKGAADP